jgi:uncharacterized protein
MTAVARGVTTAGRRCSKIVTIRIISSGGKKMEMIKRLEPIALLIVVLGALNWGMVGLFETNVISDVFGGGTLTDVIYTVVGVCGLVLVPRTLEGMHVKEHMPHPRGT